LRLRINDFEFVDTARVQGGDLIFCQLCGHV
jgi:hypothetical protein